ncbi:polysaccharide lyase family 8 protein [Cristinia sonorae]|uniref:Polysaccharide lyase family 8 protein n=1 Tax=Cristinia sonorae TaxID=1940300 RepID=A0A8K0XS66_9AGAR|nr:polysaccharide lyase family 8 protein [Cristinia sonorae]
MQDDIHTLAARRFDIIVGGLSNQTSIPAWLNSLGPDGRWPDSEIDYTAGCKAQSANWPASFHWVRIANMAAAWRGGFGDVSDYVNDTNLRSLISRAMGYWFTHDFSNPSCLVSGGQHACSCSTPGLWNPNWFANVVLVPKLMASSCLLLNGSLTSEELAHCSSSTTRAYGTFSTGIVDGFPVTGANTLDIATIGIDNGLFTSNSSLVSDAFTRIHNEVVLQRSPTTDGIQEDGSFAQHGGIIYNGNYGKDYLNDAIAIEIEAAGTRFQANNHSRSALEKLVNGDQWMIYRNTLTDVLHWDFSVLGRFISLPVNDDQATADIHLNLTQIQLLGQLWGSDTFTSAYNTLTQPSADANVGSTSGNRMFYANDYMVNRGPGYVTSLRMYSSRTRNSECINTQNPLGFHLSDGATYTYLKGNEYEDIAAAWDWNMIPGTTVDYGGTPLNCATSSQMGAENFAGGVSDGKMGIAAMRYRNPLTKAFTWQKAWFFLGNDVQHVMIAKITSGSRAPVFSMLDQRRHDGDIIVDGDAISSGNYTNVSSLWHGGVGYTFNPQGSVSLSISVGDRTGDWSKIGSSHQPPTTVDLFAAWLVHLEPGRAISYNVFPGTTLSSFQSKASNSSMQSIRNDGSISAMTDSNMAFVVFWDITGGSVSLSTSGAPFTLTTNGPSMVMVNMAEWTITVAEPTQTLGSLTLGLTLGTGSAPSGWPSSTNSKTLNVQLPQGGHAGSSVTQAIFTK